MSLSNDVGLLAEEYDTELGRMVGNFPQAFSHVALVNTAHNLIMYEKPAHQRSDAKAGQSLDLPAIARSDPDAPERAAAPVTAA